MADRESTLMRSFEKHPAISSLLESISGDEGRTMAQGIRGGLTGILTALVHVQRAGKPTLVVTPNPQRAKDIFSDASFMLDQLSRDSEDEVFLFEDLNLIAQDFLTLGELDIIFYRYRVLEKLIVNSPILVVASRSSLGIPLVAPARYREKMMSLKPGDAIEDKNKLLRSLFEIGYRLVSLVREIGQVAGRGGIIDIFPPGQKRPVRIDLFGDEIESLREFDPETQRSLGQIQNIRISPCFEAELLRDQDPDELFDVEGELRDPSRFYDDPVKFREFSDEEKDEFQARGYAYFDKAGIWDYLPTDSLVIVEAPGRTLSRSIAMELPKGSAGDGLQLPEHEGLVHSVDDIARGLSIFPRLEFLSPTCPSSTSDTSVIDLKSHPVKTTTGSFDRRLEQYVLNHADQGTQGGFFIVSRSSERIKEMIGADWPSVQIQHGDLSEGFDLTPAGPLILTDAELFPSRKRGFARTRGKTRAFTREELRQVRMDDYLVHVHHGIGIFRGIVQQKGPDGSILDYVLLEYAQNDRLYVPVEQIDQLYRYTSAEGAAPAINRLGTSDWDRLKRKAKKTMVRMAEDLLRLYRSRMEITGHKFQPDTVWQKEVEDRFEFQETPGQLRSLDELKQDMEHSLPMDRLICGEVGYGKTELAIRAALKCILDGMQVAVLVPTTILAQQHYMTFQRRLRELPINVGLLSRFKSRKEQKETLKELKSGKVDVLIGTHRILSKDVEFNNLGLLIVDEEQKFGVRHKEKIKFLKNSIDVLTLTATPIPRTLYMSLIGLRDISIIDTPPPDRLPIRTYVKRWNPHLVKNAIQAEIARKGQVYYLHNKVETIWTVAKRLQRLVPEAHMAVAHGQMEETELEKVMIEFMSGEHDVLICTTIIENGLDIPRVNTLIVENAQNFGLAQLHQIRGRVGRSGVQAFSYFLFPMGKVLSGLASKRLEALADFSHLGAGYEIARRDLELRGAGNILGPEQHGFVSQLGFDLYSKVLTETISEVKDGEIDYDRIGVSGHVECLIKLPIDARIPPTYLHDQAERFALYRRLATVKTLDDLERLKDEMLDRFGKPPIEVMNLFEALKLRLRAIPCGVELISLNTSKKAIEVVFNYRMARDGRWTRIGDMVRQARLKPQPRGFLVPSNCDPERVISQVRHIINELEKACKPIAKPVGGGVNA